MSGHTVTGSSSLNSFPQLVRYGLDDHWLALFEDLGNPELSLGRVVRVERGGCEVVTETGTVLVGVGLGSGATSAAASGSASATVPATGDWVAVRRGRSGGGEPATAVSVLPRRTALVRSSVSRRSDAQVLATNVDVVAVVVAADVPLRLARLERLLALAWDSGARPLVVLTKADELDPADAAGTTAEVAAAAPGVDVLLASAKTGDGMPALTDRLSGTVVLIGPSGVGKSTLGNALVGAEVLRVGGVRASDGKGRHTTVHRELVTTSSGGVLIDTPGLRGVGLSASADDGLAQVFAEVEELAADCRFNDCGHTTEPGCAVLDAVETGSLPARRLDSYRKLLREAEWAAARTDARLRAEREQRWKAVHLAQRRHYQERRR